MQKKLESFFRFFLAAKNKDLPNKNAVYKLFVKWFEQNIDAVGTEGIFKEIVKYAEYHAIVYRKKLSEIEKELQQPLKEFRNIASDMPAPMLLELLNMESKKIITAEQVGGVIDLTNTYLIRRALCSLDTSSITRLFPSLLKNVIEDCKGDYSNVLEIFKKNLINKNRGNAMYMPDEQQLKEAIINANMYNIRTTTRLFFDKLELHNNSAPVDLTTLSVEHLMPQTPTGEWYEELGIDEDTYQRNLHRLGNLTLATKVDNSIMKNKVWKYKNAVLAKTGHLTINQELLKIDHWNINEIDKRTVDLINQINMLYPYTPSSLSMASRVDIQITANDIIATGHLDLDNGSVEIDAGSEAVPAKHLSETQCQDDLRQELLEAEVLAETENGYKFIKPYTFYTKYVNSTALSQSAGFLLCGSRNGWDYWLDDNGKSLGENQELRKKLS